MKRFITACLTVILGVLCVVPSRASTYTQTQRNKNLAHEIAEIMRSEGHPENHPVIIACQEWWQSEDKAETVAVMYTTKEQRAKYPVAAADWQILRELGMSEVCAAAIIGNYMAESGGHTMDYDPYQDVDGCYGKAAWTKVYFPDVVGTSSNYQTEYTVATLEQQFGSHLQEFLNETDVRRAARLFSDYYERPRVWNRERADNAEAVLKYFGG